MIRRCWVGLCLLGPGLFETDATGKVSRWRVGIAPQIDYIEGCA